MQRRALFAALAAQGLPRNYTGLIAPGYVPAGDSRIIQDVEDNHPAVSYVPAYDVANDGVYSGGTAHFRNGAGGSAFLTYYGGGFEAFCYSYYQFAPSEVYDNGQLVGILYWGNPDAATGSPYLHSIGKIDLPQGLHNLEFRAILDEIHVIAFQDLIRLLPKPA